MVGSVARDGGQIDSEALVVGPREAVAAIVAARSAAVGIHPPHGGVGEQLEHVCTALAGLEHHGALVQVSGPMPAGGVGILALWIHPISVNIHLPFQFGAFVFARLIAASTTHVVAYDIEAEPGIAIDRLERVNEVRIVIGIAGSAYRTSPPRQ